MDDPVVDIRNVVLNLTTGSPPVQQKTLETYFTPDSSFKHPFCSVNCDRRKILRIFQWYKILSPHIKIHINSVAYDEQKLVLYVNISQTFAIWFVPFHCSPVTLTTLLQLVHGQNLNDPSSRINTPARKYYISSQNDLYQVDEFVKFIAPWGIGTTIIMLWHWFATLVCVIGATLLQPFQPLFAELSRPLTGRNSTHEERSRKNKRIVEELYDVGSDEVKPRRVRPFDEDEDGTGNVEHFSGDNQGGMYVVT